ncbi:MULTISPECIES: hypothetical protein [Bacillaceae]|uniref:Uncharacterized protein n=1 Tax=Evansella alkalicola TaxID=745819 RepID=A0ABS6JZ45_9BACI|nr:MULTISPECIES: hypothetical protein [Bacillaceae]MBU9723502.1 hypothetical protein [Bacillus alkalicola]
MLRDETKHKKCNIQKTIEGKRLQVIIADRMSQECGVLIHCLRTSEPVSAGKEPMLSKYRLAIGTKLVPMAVCII